MHEFLQKILQRPLCLFVVSYLVVSFIVQICMTRPLAGAASVQNGDARLVEGAQVMLTGQLSKKETKNDHLIYYLKDIQIIEVNDSKENSKQNSKQISSRNEYKTNETEQTGAICYMRNTGTSVNVYAESDSDEKDPPIGRWLYVQGEVLPFEKAENDGQFDAQAYYRGIGIGLRLWNTCVLSQGKSYDSFGESAVDIKLKITSKYHKFMKRENAGILCAMLLGDKILMDAEIKSLYRKSGISHVLAISGLHISLLGMLFYRFLRRIYLPPPLCNVLGIGLVLIYIKTVGFSVSSSRAVCMFVLYMLADLLGRTYDLLTALAFSALLLLADNPRAMFEAGFLLSYFAVLGIAIVLPVLEEELADIFGQGHKPKSRKFQMREFMCTLCRKVVCSLLPGFSVQVLIFPVTLWFYYEFPLYSFLLNLIVVPCMSIVLVSGIIGALPGCGFVLCLTEVLLEWYELLCRLVEYLPGSVIVTGRPEVWQVVIYYVLIGIWLVGIRFRRSRKKRMLTVIFPLFCMLLFLFPVHRETRVDMLSVGQGDCICVRDSKGHVVLVDGGSTDVSEVGKYRLLPFLKYHGISEVDAVFLSHAHADHYSAIEELFKVGYTQGVRVKTLCLTGYAANPGKPEVTGEAVISGDSKDEPTGSTSSSKVYAELIELAENAGCEVVYLTPGDHVACGEMEFDCIYPPAEISVADENDSSMVLLAQLEGFSMLFTGDSTSACDAQVIRRLRTMGVRKVDCLKVAHHGAQTSTSQSLLEAFDFKLALISSGIGNSYGHPHKQLLERLRHSGCETFVTAESGQVTVRIRKGKISVSGYGKNRGE